MQKMSRWHIGFFYGGTGVVKTYNEKRFYNFREIVNFAAENYKDKTAFKIKLEQDKYRTVSFTQLRQLYYKLCSHMLEKGLRGKRIAVTGRNCFEWAISYLCAATVGVVVPIDKELQAEDVNDFINAAECDAVFTHSKRNEEIKKTAKREMYHVDFEELDSIIADSTVDRSAEIDGFTYEKNQMSVLIFTSGTTGNSKGVCLSQYNICSNIHSTSRMFRVNSNDTTLSILPLHHTYECTLDFILFLTRGACITYCESLTKVQKNMVEYSPTILVVVPALLKVLSKRIQAKLAKEAPEKYRKYFETLSLPQALEKCPWLIRRVIISKVKKSLGGKLRVFIVGAAELDISLIDDFAVFGIRTLQGYGLTECAPLVAGNGDFHFNAASTGIAIPDVQLKIDNPNEEGVGEILAKGENIMLGYFNDPDATAQVLQDGWFHTGDLGYIDSQGDLYIKGRIKNVIVTENGKNIYPEELETRLSQCPEIGEALVCAAEEGGVTTVKAKIFPNMEYLKEKFGDKKLSEEEIKSIVQNAIKTVNSKIPNYKHIKMVEVLSNALEKTTTQKIKRFGKNVK